MDSQELSQDNALLNAAYDQFENNRDEAYWKAFHEERQRKMKHQCQLCKRRFTLRCDSEMCCEPEKRFPCRYCGGNFTRKWYQQRHLQKCEMRKNYIKKYGINPEMEPTEQPSTKQEPLSVLKAKKRSRSNSQMNFAALVP